MRWEYCTSGAKRTQAVRVSGIPRARPQRGAVGLVEVGVAAAILGAGLVMILGLIQHAYRASALDAERDLARLLAANIAGSLEGVPFSRVEAEFGAQGLHRGDAAGSSLLEGLIPAGRQGAGGVDICFRRAPGDPGVGYLEIRVHPANGSGQDAILRRTIIDPIRSGLVASQEGEDPDDHLGAAFRAISAGAPSCTQSSADQEQWVRRNQQALTAFIEAMPSDPIAAVLARAAALDAQDGKLDRDYSRLAFRPGSPRRWERVLGAMGDDTIADGVYDVRWDSVHVMPFAGSDVTRAQDVTIYILRSAMGDERVLVTTASLAADGDGPRFTVGATPATDEGDLAIARIASGSGLARPRDAAGVHVFHSARRLFCRYETHDASGTVVPFRPRMLVATVADRFVPVGSGKAALPAIRSAAKLAGIELAPAL